MPEPERLDLIGGGGHAAVVYDAAISTGWKVLGFFDDDARSPLGRITTHLGSLSAAGELGSDGAASILCLGDLEMRRRLIGSLTRRWITVSHERAWASSEAALGDGAFLGANAVVQSRATIGPHAIINTGAIVEHDCRIGENVHVAPRSVLAGNVSVGADTLIGVGAVVAPGVQIGDGCTIGAGACVIRDIADGQTVVGVPGRPLAAR